MTREIIERIARECGFELAGVAAADPPEDFARYQAWAAQGMAGEMRYLTDRRGDLRRDVRNLLPSAKSVICVGKLYNQRSEPAPPGHATISRYAWGKDYHDVMRDALETMAARLSEHASFEWKACVDTAPVLERTFARLAGLGWIGKNTCLINEPRGSWFFLGELITSLELEVSAPPPERCGSCTRCIEACPTDAFVPAGDWFSIDARRCISYFTIELRGAIPEEFRDAIGSHVFGCDICQDVCPWNSRAPVTFDPGLTAAAVIEGGVHNAPALESLAELTESQFREMFRESPLARPKFSGFLRNVAIAMGNSGLEKFRPALERLAGSGDEVVAEHARWALRRFENKLS